LGTYFGFVPPPAQFYFILAAMVMIYLSMVEFAKKGFFRWYTSSERTGRAMGSVARFGCG
jgi:Mg2+-importing ATPase